MVLLSEKCRRRTVLPRQRGRDAGGGTSQLYTLKLYTHTRAHAHTTCKYPLRRDGSGEKENERDATRERQKRKRDCGKRNTEAGTPSREKEREIERESTLRIRRAPVFPHRRTDGRAIPLGDHLTAHQQLPPDGYRVRRLLGIPFASHRSTPVHRTWNSLTDHDASSGTGRTAERYGGAKRGERRRSFVVKRYRSARGFKRLLYEYTRGGGINGVAPLSCRRRRCVFARRNRRIISVIVVVARGVGASA